MGESSVHFLVTSPTSPRSSTQSNVGYMRSRSLVATRTQILKKAKNETAFQGRSSIVNRIGTDFVQCHDVSGLKLHTFKYAEHELGHRLGLGH